VVGGKGILTEFASPQSRHRELILGCGRA